MGFDVKTNLLILGDIFGNVEIWNIDPIIHRARYNKKYLSERFAKKKTISTDKGEQHVHLVAYQ